MTPREVEERVTRPMEKLLWEIPGVEYIYTTSSPGMFSRRRSTSATA
jgi:multidrug efflux pump subunit AcrB